MRKVQLLIFWYEVGEGLGTINTLLGGSKLNPPTFCQGMKERVLRESNTFSDQGIHVTDLNFLFILHFFRSSITNREWVHDGSIGFNGYILSLGAVDTHVCHVGCVLVTPGMTHHIAALVVCWASHPNRKEISRKSYLLLILPADFIPQCSD